MSTVDWANYQRVIENVPAEDGGGYRIYYPTLGYACYGVGDTLDEAEAGLIESQCAYVILLGELKQLPPEPTVNDLLFRARTVNRELAAANNNLAYAA